MFVFLTCRGLLASHDSSPYPNRSCIARKNATKIGSAKTDPVRFKRKICVFEAYRSPIPERRKAHFYKQHRPCFDRPLNWTGSVVSLLIIPLATKSFFNEFQWPPMLYNTLSAHTPKFGVPSQDAKNDPFLTPKSAHFPCTNANLPHWTYFTHIPPTHPT